MHISRNHLTVGILGHVDHGKTSLVKALTGAETDRLAEEKRRGLSIVLGFAFQDSESGIIDFIDVPGHESFIHTMISGATGIDTVILVVAADEGVKPQTREHLAIAELLGIKRGIIVLNKADLADQDLLSLARSEVEDFVDGTFLEGAPVFNVSAYDGTGIHELSAALNKMLETKQSRIYGDNFHLPLDRVFTIDGFGTIGTGTLRNGTISCDGEVEIMPEGQKATIRELQVHNNKVKKAYPGQRVAVNLRGIKRHQLGRGQILIKPRTLDPTSCIHARMKILDNLPRLPKRNEPVRLLFGTQQVIAKLRTIDNGPLEPGSEILVKLLCRTPVVACTGEHFIVRTCSPILTFGGGEILDTSESLLDMPVDELVNHLYRLQNSDAFGRIDAHLQAAGSRGISFSGLTGRAMVSDAEINTVITRKDAVLIADTLLLERQVFEDICNRTVNMLQDFHNDNPAQPGLGLEHFRAEISRSSPSEVVEFLIHSLIDDGKIHIDGSTVRLSGFNQESSFSTSDRDTIESIEQIFRTGGTATPALDVIIGSDPAKKRAYLYLKEAGRLIPVKDNMSKRLLVFHIDTIEDLKEVIKGTYPTPAKFTVSDIRLLTGTSRKFIIPILELFDRTGFTLRYGNDRVLSDKVKKPYDQVEDQVSTV